MINSLDAVASIAIFAFIIFLFGQYYGYLTNFDKPAVNPAYVVLAQLLSCGEPEDWHTLVGCDYKLGIEKKYIREIDPPKFQAFFSLTEECIKQMLRVDGNLTLNVTNLVTGNVRTVVREPCNGRKRYVARGVASHPDGDIYEFAVMICQ